VALLDSAKRKLCMPLIKLVTHADEVTRVAGAKRSSASVCVCLFVLATHLILGQRSRSQGHKVQKHISGDRVAGVSLHSISYC